VPPSPAPWRETPRRCRSLGEATAIARARARRSRRATERHSDRVQKQAVFAKHMVLDTVSAPIELTMASRFGPTVRQGDLRTGHSACEL
jgi:hypothetical protein